jgi:hypothetical protein
LFARWLQGQKNESDAVVRVQSDAWLAR